MGFSDPAFAHDLRPGCLQLRQTAPDTYDVFWKVPTPGPNPLSGPRVELPTDCVDVVPPRTEIVDGSFIERRTVKRPGGLDGKTIFIAGLAETTIDVIVRIERLDGSTRINRLTPASSSFVVESAPNPWQAALTYLGLGFQHILLGVDHLLFVLGLLLIVKDGWTLLKTITAFTVAHSLTLGIATLGFASVPTPPLNAAIALSILFLGPEIVRSWRGETSLTIQRPWIVAFAFGLLHGFGFASGLSIAGLDHKAIPEALFLFNVGVELGQLTFVGLMLAMSRAFAVLQMRWPLWMARLPGYAVGICGVFWTIQRTTMLFAK
jgi:hydrogenase/urease accessory protein HupE